MWEWSWREHCCHWVYAPQPVSEQLLFPWGSPWVTSGYAVFSGPMCWFVGSCHSSCFLRESMFSRAAIMCQESLGGGLEGHSWAKQDGLLSLVFWPHHKQSSPFSVLHYTALSQGCTQRMRLQLKSFRSWISGALSLATVQASQPGNWKLSQDQIENQKLSQNLFPLEF